MFKDLHDDSDIQQGYIKFKVSNLILDHLLNAQYSKFDLGNEHDNI